MALFHELLAAEPNVASAHHVVTEETMKIFSHPQHFLRTVKSEHYFSEEDAKLNKQEVTANVTTVPERLSYSFGRAFIAHLDVIAQKDRTNQEARADLIVNGAVLLRDIPATTLLSLEGRLAEKRRELEAAPTLQPGPVWEWDANERMYKTASPTIGFRTKKTIRPIVLHEGTKEHPPQIQPVNEDIAIARLEQTTWSGMWTSKAKHDALTRIDALIIAVKKARQRANRVDVVRLSIGRPIADFILTGPAAEQINSQDSDDQIVASTGL